MFARSRVDKRVAKRPEIPYPIAFKELKEKYRRLHDKKKIKWIGRSVAAIAEYKSSCKAYMVRYPALKPTKSLQTKEELLILAIEGVEERV